MTSGLGLAFRTTVLLLPSLWMAACSPAPDALPQTGPWRAVLKSPGGDLPFTLQISSEGGEIQAVALNGLEEVPFTSVDSRQGRIVLRIDGYDSEIRADLSQDGRRLSGEWKRRSSNGFSKLDFEAVHGDQRRFLPEESEGGDGQGIPSSVGGDWRVVFSDEDGDTPARGEFFQQGSHLRGTFLTPTGDYRYLEGDYSGGLLRLSCFDGAHAFLFRARARADGTLAGDFWSREFHSASWTARHLGEDEPDPLPNPYQQVSLTNRENRFHFSFPDLDGRIVSSSDERFAGKVVLVNIFGSWCPNCNDEAPLLAQWYESYWDEGLEIVGLAYEMSGDPVRDREYVRKYARRHGIRYPLLLAGTSEKQAAAATLPDLSRVRAFPTSILIGRDGTVRRILSGFAGPATGKAHEKLVGELESLIRLLLSEPVSRQDAKSAK